MADHRFAAQDRGIGVDDDVVFDRGVALGVADDLAGLSSRGKLSGAQGDALVELDSVADLGRLADDDAGAVIDEESPADRGAGVDVDAGLAVRVFGHHPGDQRHAQAIELVGQAIDGDGRQPGVAKDDLVEALGGRVAVEGGLHVLRRACAAAREALQKANHDPFGLLERIAGHVPSASQS